MEFEVWTDHKNLQYFMTSQKLNQRQAQWTLYLLYCNFILKYIPEKSIGKANRLSQRVDQQERVENNNKNRTLIRLKWIRGVETLVEDRSLRKKIKKVQEGDKKVIKVVEELKRAGMKSLRDEEQSIEKGVVMKEGCIYILERELRGEVVCLHHDMPVGGYRGRWKIAELVTRNYQWPEVTREVGRYVDRYDTYQ